MLCLPLRPIYANSYPRSRLFAHFFGAFSNIFGCSDPPAQPPSSSGSSSSLSLAYVHKYMNLNYTDLGYFINQLSMATTKYGFSDQDSQTLNTDLNGLYNVRCAPPVTEHSTQGPQLLSLCQADTCPLAVPDADCAAYVNLTANGIVAGVSSSQGSTGTPTPFIPTTISFTSAPTSSASTEPTSTATHSSTTSSKATLSPGAFAGIAIGGAAVLLAAVVALVFLLRRRRPVQQMSYPTAPMSLASPPGEQKFPPFTSQLPSPPLDQSFASFTSPTLSPTIAEMDSTHEGNAGGWL